MAIGQGSQARAVERGRAARRLKVAHHPESQQACVPQLRQDRERLRIQIHVVHSREPELEHHVLGT